MTAYLNFGREGGGERGIQVMRDEIHHNVLSGTAGTEVGTIGDFELCFFQ